MAPKQWTIQLPGTRCRSKTSPGISSGGGRFRFLGHASKTQTGELSSDQNLYWSGFWIIKLQYYVTDLKSLAFGIVTIQLHHFSYSRSQWGRYNLSKLMIVWGHTILHYPYYNIYWDYHSPQGFWFERWVHGKSSDWTGHVGHGCLKVFLQSSNRYETWTLWRKKCGSFFGPLNCHMHTWIIFTAFCACTCAFVMFALHIVDLEQHDDGQSNIHSGYRTSMRGF